MEKRSINIANMLQGSKVSGPGKRDLIWVQGCSIGCKGCFNKQLWSYDPKYIIPVDGLVNKFKSRIGQIDGVTILGGEPTEQAEALSYFLEGMKVLGLSTVVYTGLTYEEHMAKESKWIKRLFSFTDILIDGPFILERKDTDLLWRGSSNQRILFMTDAYNKSILKMEKPHNEEIHVFIKDDNEILFKTGIE